jgi:hypothetical protein
MAVRYSTFSGSIFADSYKYSILGVLFSSLDLCHAVSSFFVVLYIEPAVTCIINTNIHTIARLCIMARAGQKNGWPVKMAGERKFQLVE